MLVSKTETHRLQGGTFVVRGSCEFSVNEVGGNLIIMARGARIASVSWNETTRLFQVLGWNPGHLTGQGQFSRGATITVTEVDDGFEVKVKPLRRAGQHNAKNNSQDSLEENRSGAGQKGAWTQTP